MNRGYDGGSDQASEGNDDVATKKGEVRQVEEEEELEMSLSL